MIANASNSEDQFYDANNEEDEEAQACMEKLPHVHKPESNEVGDFGQEKGQKVIQNIP